ncbi:MULTISPECIES: lambda-exonuclease family protein [Arthrobacter]|uniref:lambda-exonuclease family protein n=1 Tax=Arthrobacter TaxID=1663 RepID=UPI0014045817|nr:MULTISPECIES: YqaJ viral recombinase family protein [Arthrobacter]MBT8161044.1 YqaJ viral recombinase family protein [Arthrobacter sp. GN70]
MTVIRESTILGNAEYVGTFEQDSPEWHAQRGEVIGSSDIASILGLSHFKSAYTLWHEKAGLIEPKTPDERWQNKLDYGHFMEPFVASKFMQKNPEYSLQETGSWRSTLHPWQGCNPDRLVHLVDTPSEVPTAHSVVELKTFPSLADWADGPSAGYIAQLKWQLDVFGFPMGWVAGYANLSGDYVQYPFELDPFEADAVRAKARAFADSITEGVAPDIDGSDSTYQTLRRLNPSIPDPKAEAVIPDEIAEQYLEAANNAKVSESELLKAKGHLLAFMGTAKFAVYDGKKIASRVAIKDGVPYLKEA